MLSEDPNSNLERVYHLKLWLKERPGCAHLLGASHSHMMPRSQRQHLSRCAGSHWVCCYFIRDRKDGHKELTTGRVLATLL